jgi:hypothetical protein
VFIKGIGVFRDLVDHQQSSHLSYPSLVDDFDVGPHCIAADPTGIFKPLPDSVREVRSFELCSAPIDFSFMFDGMKLRRGVIALGAAIAALSVLAPARVTAGDIDSEHIFGFMIGSDVGQVGERELQSETTGRFGKAGGRYRAAEQEIELEIVPAKNIRVEIGTSFAAHRIAGVPGLDDQRALGWQGASVDFRYRFLDRATTPLGLTLAFETQTSRIDETSAARVHSYGSGVTLALDHEIVPDVAIAALNLFYQPEWTRYQGAGTDDREASLGVALGVMLQVRPGILLGGEVRYMRRYEGLGLDELAGQALFIGPTAYIQLSERTRLSASWSAQVYGRTGTASGLDLVNFERHQARLVYGVNF